MAVSWKPSIFGGSGPGVIRVYWWAGGLLHPESVWRVQVWVGSGWPEIRVPSGSRA